MGVDTRQVMVQHTIRLLAQKGLQGASFSEILKASGAPRGSLYHHFPGGKDELVLAALDEVDATSSSFLESLKGKSTDEIVRAFTSSWRDVLTEGALEAGCPIVAVAVAAEIEPLTSRAGLSFSSWRKRMAALLVTSGVPEARAPGLAALMLSTCEGAVAIARAERSIDAFDLAASELHEIVAGAASHQ